MIQTNKKKFDLDPRTKISILILTNISIFVSRNIIDEILLISMTYNSILNNEEYLDTKKALESLRRGRN